MVRKQRKTKKINIREIFLGLQNQMRSKLTLNRRILTHPVAKGDAAELEWIDMLSIYLPLRYRVDKAFVIDSKGNISDQIDIVIFDRQYSPFILRQNGATYIPAESVYAIIEVKPTLSKKNIIYASRKALSVRRLRRTAAPIVHAGGKIQKPKEPFRILAGILTIDGSCTKHLEKCLINLKGNRILNFGCSLDKEAFCIKFDSSNQIAFERSKKEEGLIYFFLNLLSMLQELGTVPAIEIREYAKRFKNSI